MKFDYNRHNSLVKGAVSLRVIAGSAKRMVLIAPDGLNTRPTSDRAKESLFSILGEKVPGAHFLDMFCGSGAIGIEALSRGATSAVFVDSSPQAIKAVNANLAKTKLGQNAEALLLKADKSIQKLVAENRKFDIIFIDPPYGTNLMITALKNLIPNHLLAENGVIIAETDAKDSPEIPPGFILESTRVYGRAKFLFIYVDIGETS